MKGLKTAAHLRSFDTDTSATGLTVIDTVTILDVVEPLAGEHPDQSAATVPENAGYQVLRVYWEYDNKYLKDDDTFIEGEEYTASIWVNAIDGETRFPMSNVTATINGHSVTDIYYYDEGEYIMISYVFTCADPAIKYVKVTVTAPVAGEAPTYTGSVPEGANYDAALFDWYDKDGNNNFGTFEAGKEYVVWIAVSSHSG